jgi:RNA polymerase sigma factor (sigma-70 family)
MAESLDSVSLYFHGVKRLSDTSKEDVTDLWRLAKKGDKKAKKRLVESNLRLVIPVAKKYYRSGVDFIDLIMEGNLGLMHAVDKFDPKRGFRFSTYASYWIEQSIRRAYDEQSKLIRIPPHALEALRRWLRAWESMRVEFGRSPTIQEMGKKLSLSPRQIRSVVDAHEAAKPVGSLDMPLDEDENLYLRDMLSDSAERGPERIFSILRDRSDVSTALKGVGPRERMILELRFGVTGKLPMTLEQVGKKLRISRERVRQLEERAMARLRRVSSRMGLR